MSDRERQVRERAYFMWEAEGRPEGRAEMHWLMAEIATALQSYLNASEQDRLKGAGMNGSDQTNRVFNRPAGKPYAGRP